MRSTRNNPKTISIREYIIKTSYEPVDTTRVDGKKKRPYAVKLYKDGIKIKSSYWASKKDVNTAERLIVAIVGISL